MLVLGVIYGHSGCILFGIRTVRKLFDTFDDDQDEYLSKMAMILGKLPEPW